MLKKEKLKEMGFTFHQANPFAYPIAHYDRVVKDSLGNEIGHITMDVMNDKGDKVDLGTISFRTLNSSNGRKFFGKYTLQDIAKEIECVEKILEEGK